ncbi:hypothetical protein [Bacillus solitudinis]|uniref:hypothetical protein n=1 Tax=Bacillus solitudinis TaxID=2014074 RepID=UPI000C237227|nr:hypothetical protein [Bacillus solitudinis]
MYLKRLQRSAKHVFEMMAAFIETNTFYIAFNDGQSNRMFQTFNKKKVLLIEGFETMFKDAY